jgi:hypothetical protein
MKKRNLLNFLGAFTLLFAMFAIMPLCAMAGNNNNVLEFSVSSAVASCSDTDDCAAEEVCFDSICVEATSSILCDDPDADNYNDYSECGCKYSDLFAGQQNSLCPSEISIMVFQEWMDIDFCLLMENGNKSWTKAQYEELLVGLGKVYNLTSFDYYEDDVCNRTPGEYFAERYQEPYENGDCKIDGVNQFTFPPAPWDGTFVSNIVQGDLYWHFVGFMVRTEEATNPFSCCKQMFQSDDWTVFTLPKCQASSDCTDGMCVEEVCVDYECIDNSDCDDLEVCVDSICVEATSAECVDDSDCDDLDVCVDSICVEATSGCLLEPGVRVAAVVDYPSNSPCIMAGMTGTVICQYTPSGRWLVEWDELTCGHNGKDLCGVTPDGTGWYVYAYEIDCLDDECPDDDDCDMVLNDDDLCPMTPEGEIVDPDTGCSIDQLCPCDRPMDSIEAWKNHGKYVSCVSKQSEGFFEMDLISEFEQDAIVSEAAKSECGKKKKK